MKRHFLRYWVGDKGNWNVLNLPQMTYSASNQYDRLNIGDELWAVVRDRTSHRLVLVGRMTVDWIGDKQEAAQKVEMRPEDLWDGANIFVVCDNPESFDYIDINDSASNLRFISSQNDRLTLENGLVNPQQLQTMRQLHPESISLLRDIWCDTSNIKLSISPDMSDVTFTEGRKKLRLHIQRERNSALVNTAKQQFKNVHGSLFCEVCGFDFSSAYGDLGDDFIEAHHRHPLSELKADETKQTIDSLAMVCANCHRMLHRRKPWLSVEELIAILSK